MIGILKHAKHQASVSPITEDLSPLAIITLVHNGQAQRLSK